MLEPETTGPLRIWEVYEEYDFPRLFSARDRRGRTYLVVSAHQAKDRLDWLIAELSHERLEAVRDGVAQVRDVFESPEDACLIHYLQYRNGTTQTELVSPSDIESSWLPAPGHLGPISEARSRTDPVVVARVENRDVIDLAIETAPRKHEIPSKAMGKTLTTLQALVDAAGEWISGRQAVRGPIPDDIAALTAMNFQAAFAGSLIIRLRAAQNTQMIEGALQERALTTICDLVGAGADESALREMLRAISPRTANRYRAFLASLSELHAAVSVEYATSRSSQATLRKLTRAEIQDALRIVSEVTQTLGTTVTVEAILVGLNVRLQIFELRTSDDEKIAGQLSNPPDESLQHATVNERYTASLLQIVETNESTGQEVMKYVLERLEHL